MVSINGEGENHLFTAPKQGGGEAPPPRQPFQPSSRFCRNRIKSRFGFGCVCGVVWGLRPQGSGARAPHAVRGKSETQGERSPAFFHSWPSFSPGSDGQKRGERSSAFLHPWFRSRLLFNPLDF